jgi:rubrerythrin
MIDDAVLQTGTVMAELVAKAKEARASGHSRRDFFARTAKLAGATALGVAGVNFVQPIAARAATSEPSNDSVTDILNIACTAETLAITFYGHALAHPNNLPTVNNEANQNYFQAALTQEYEHLMYLHSLGGKTLATKFYFPTGMFYDEPTFFATASTLEDYFISAYIAAAMDFSGAYSNNITSASPSLIGAAVQIAGVESEHRALLRVASGANPPNNRIIESGLLTSVAGAVPVLTNFLQSGGSGFSTTAYTPPSVSTINTLAGPYGTSFFPKPVYV